MRLLFLKKHGGRKSKKGLAVQQNVRRYVSTSWQKAHSGEIYEKQDGTEARVHKTRKFGLRPDVSFETALFYHGGRKWCWVSSANVVLPAPSCANNFRCFSCLTRAMCISSHALCVRTHAPYPDASADLLRTCRSPLLWQKGTRPVAGISKKAPHEARDCTTA